VWIKNVPDNSITLLLGIDLLIDVMSGHLSVVMRYWWTETKTNEE